MPHNNCDPTYESRSGAAERCPKCRAEMEPIAVAVEGLHLRDLRLCPSCYLVTWRDESGFHSRQGVPVRGSYTLGESSQATGSEPTVC